jgi:hypothetical protein
LLSIIPAQEIGATEQALQTLRSLQTIEISKGVPSAYYSHFGLFGMLCPSEGKFSAYEAEQFELAYNKRLAASFFFSRGRGDLGRASRFATSVALQLANRSRSLRENICEAIRDRKDIAYQSLRSQWNHLILHPLTKVEAGSFQSPLVLVVDALDECDGEEDIRLILQLLAECYRMLRRILGTIVILYSPLSTTSLAMLLNVPETEMGETLEDLHAILDIPELKCRPISLHHPSFRDFILDEGRRLDKRFLANKEKSHMVVGDRCIQLMSEKLKRDMWPAYSGLSY